MFEDILDMDKQKYLITNEKMETNLPGVYACGDVRDKELRQVSTAVGDGAVAGVEAEKFIAEAELFKNQILQKDKVGFIYLYSAIDAPSREMLPMLQEIETEFGGTVKLNLLDVYKGKSLCEKLSCDAEPMTIFYTKDGVVVEQSRNCDKPHIISKLNSLL